MAAKKAGIGRPRNSAIKDAQLTYRACTLGYAQSLQLSSPTQLVGQTDFDFLSDRGAALVHAAEQRVLQTGTTEIIAGEILSKRTAGRYFVRTPVLNRSGQVCGVEIFVVGVEELHRSYQLLLGSEMQLRDVIDQSPFGLLIHRNYELIFVNASWLELTGSAGTSPSAEEVRRLVASGAGEELKTIKSIQADGSELELSLQSRSVRWNGSDAQAVYCVPFSAGAVDAGFVEKRTGHRRHVDSQPLVTQLAIDEEFFKNIKQPMIVCDGWRPVQANSAAQKLLKTDSVGQYRTIKKWFSDRDRSSVEALLSGSHEDTQFVNARVERKTRKYTVYISTVLWAGRDHLLFSLQPVEERQSELELSNAKLRDYVAAAGDFFWEMDSNQRMTHVSMDMKGYLGVENSQIINVPFEALINEYVDPEDVPEWKVLIADLNKHLPFRAREYQWLRKDGEKRVVRLSGVPVFDNEDNFVGYRGVGWDVTAQHHSASIVAYHASHDSLTGLVNRREFEQLCDAAVSRSATARQALCFIDLDNFKRVNDTAGHLAGDELLRQLSTLFTGLVRKSDVLARLGGDEFGLLIYDVGIKEALRLANQLRAEVESFHFHWEGKQFSVGASIGLVLIDERWETRSSMFGAADAACYEAKSQGRNRVAVYTEKETKADSHGDRQWDEFIKSAIADRNIKLAIQKIVPAKSTDSDQSRIEVLMRLPSPDGELLMPAAVLPLAERYGLSVRLDKAVVEATLDWLKSQPHVTDRLELCCINLSGASIADEAFLKYLLKLLERTPLDKSVLCFEVSESAVSTNLTAVSKFMEQLGGLGCQFAMDDFSGGLNSFSYLKKLPVNFVKINSTFVQALLDDPVHYAMVKSINDVAKTLGKQTIAESVESQAVLDKLRELDVSLVQGYHIAAPEIIDF